MHSHLLPLLIACGLSQAVATKPICCWSKWGDDSTCGGYDGSGSQCNTDHTKTCNSDGDCSDTPAPSPPSPTPPSPTPPSPTPPSPTPPAPPSPPPSPVTEIIGYWSATWESDPAPTGANLGIAFSGWNDPEKAQDESKAVHDKLVGAKWIDAGGGNKNGRWNADWLGKWEALIKSGGLKDWEGIVFDIEECYNAGLEQAFADVLRAAKAAGLGTLVTVSHSAPYACSDPKELMQSFFQSSDIDYLSPQLYTSGNEPDPSFVAGNQVTWSDWVGAKARFVPSLGCNAVKSGGYAKTQAYFAKLNIATSGYIVWPSSGCVASSNVMV